MYALTLLFRNPVPLERLRQTYVVLELPALRIELQVAKSVQVPRFGLLPISLF